MVHWLFWPKQMTYDRQFSRNAKIHPVQSVWRITQIGTPGDLIQRFNERSRCNLSAVIDAAKPHTPRYN
jgi:hypothetical protein